MNSKKMDVIIIQHYSWNDATIVFRNTPLLLVPSGRPPGEEIERVARPRANITRRRRWLSLSRRSGCLERLRKHDSRCAIRRDVQSRRKASLGAFTNFSTTDARSALGRFGWQSFRRRRVFVPCHRRIGLGMHWRGCYSWNWWRAHRLNCFRRPLLLALLHGRALPCRVGRFRCPRRRRRREANGCARDTLRGCSCRSSRSDCFATGFSDRGSVDGGAA
jgi:hypothetical protein